MGDRDEDVIELLEAAKLRVVKANAGDARAARANLAVALRKAVAEPNELTTRLSVKAFAASDFLREMAWMTDPVDRAPFAPRRDNFIAAMDQLIFEVDVSSLDARSVVPIRKAVTAAKRKLAPSPKAFVQRHQRSTLVMTLARWLSRRTERAQSVPRRPVLTGNAAARLHT
jgi:hypothetical protein